ncbi:MAG: hypothetical protein A3G05_02360 [Candidatus Zambryskibacteria bacterium RIFCSPLOWO2_12_FULL_45_14]|uniref:Uncharacterized protein n=1 Tax=Candidatus Zambryskibacteria bacterium RIFCSPLOWO2_12_FULL_45_14 TaxID=1802778 RepID=A0A1G2UW21_9BACT|nr:MAG: hypothetical protein A3G05_02360 [Candidatus Zambryskibacteria bacterium RIFCSPLOWO2_12_FULL_45_14]
MCDIHLCEKMIREIFEMGPVSLLVLPPHIALHLLECEMCAKKLTTLIVLSVEPSASERVM